MYNDPLNNYKREGWRVEEQASGFNFSLFCFVGGLLATIAILFCLHQRDTWRPINGVVVEHTPDNIVYAYQPNGNPRFTTAKFDYIDLLCQENCNSVMPGRSYLHPELNSYSSSNGRPQNPAIGEARTIYYNPDNPSQAVVNKGITSGMWIGIILVWFVFGASLLKGFLGWGDVDTSARGYDQF